MTHLWRLAPVAQELKPILHIGDGAGVQQLEQTAGDHAGLRLIRDDDPGVMTARHQIRCMQLNKISSIKGENCAVK
jgi:hypothetical protein